MAILGSGAMRGFGPCQWLVVVGLCTGWHSVLAVRQEDAVTSSQCTKLVPMPQQVQQSESCYPRCNEMHNCIKYELVHHGGRPYCQLTYIGQRCQGRTWAPTAAPTRPPGKQRTHLRAREPTVMCQNSIVQMGS